MYKKTKKYHRYRKVATRKLQGYKKGGRKNDITPEEMNKCNLFCSNYYLEKRKKTLLEYYKTNSNMTKEQLEELKKNIDENGIINNCKSIYCNPNCPNSGKNLKKRYFCCEKVKNQNNNKKAKKLGAITYCMYDNQDL